MTIKHNPSKTISIHCLNLHTLTHTHTHTLTISEFPLLQVRPRLLRLPAILGLPAVPSNTPECSPHQDATRPDDQLQETLQSFHGGSVLPASVHLPLPALSHLPICLQFQGKG